MVKFGFNTAWRYRHCKCRFLEPAVPWCCYTCEKENPMKKVAQDLGKLILRLMVGGLLIFHGISKLIHGVAWMAGPLNAYHMPFFIAYGVYIGEVVAPILVILGILTRVSGLVISFDLLMAFVLVSHARMFTLNPAGGWGLELDAFYFLSGIAVFLLGAGRYSLAGANGKWN